MENKQLSFSEAKRLSILKWEHIVKANGAYCFPLECANLNCHCGFCERWQYSGDQSTCEEQCELGMQIGICCDFNSTYDKWYDNKCKETAQAMLDAIKSVKE